MYVLSDYSSGSGTQTLVAYGVDSGSNWFCCFVDDPSAEITSLDVEGSAQNDGLHLHDGSYTYDTSTILTADCGVDGGAGADTIDGALSTGTACTLFGGSGADTITAFGADDTLAGDVGGDTLVGDAGDEYAAGYDGDDTIDLKGGDDVALGGKDNDAITLGPGADVGWGGNGDDEVCGGGGTGDSINGGKHSSESYLTGLPQYDLLFAPSGSTSPTGSVVGDDSRCGDSGAGFGNWAGAACGSSPCCTYNVGSKPAGCP